MLAQVNQVTPQDWLSLALGFGALVGGIGYATGQFISSRRKGVADSLKTALDEVEANRLKADRLALVATEKSDELAAARMQVTTLAATLTSGGAVAPEIIKAVETALAEAKRFAKDEHEKTRAAIREALSEAGDGR